MPKRPTALSAPTVKLPRIAERAQLVILVGEGTGRAFALGAEPLMIGRDEKAGGKIRMLGDGSAAWTKALGYMDLAPGTPIAGLYAAGSCTGGLEGGPMAGYLGGLGKALTTGYRAGGVIAKEAAGR